MKKDWLDGRSLNCMMLYQMFKTTSTSFLPVFDQTSSKKYLTLRFEQNWKLEFLP